MVPDLFVTETRKRVLPPLKHPTMRRTSRPASFAGVFNGLTLYVVEISRNGDDRVLDLGAEIGFRRFLHLPQHERGSCDGE